jgi:hypothetical protein
MKTIDLNDATEPLAEYVKQQRSLEEGLPTPDHPASGADPTNTAESPPVATPSAITTIKLRRFIG